MNTYKVELSAQGTMDSADATPSPRDKEIADATLRRLSQGRDMRFSSSSQILDRLYNDHGVRVRMVRRNRPNRIPTVRELIDHLAKKHDRLLEMEGKGSKIEARASGIGLSPISLMGQRDAARAGIETQRCYSDKPKVKSYIGDGARCISERVNRWVVMETDTSESIPDVRGLHIKERSSSTPTVPYSTADILYGSEVNNRNQLDDARQNSYLDLDKNRDLQRQKSKELEQHPNNRRPSSKSGSRKSLTIEAVALDKEDSLKNLTSSLPPAKVANHFRPNGIRSLKGEPQPYPAKTNGALPSRDQDDLVAMGTLWSPNNNTNSQQQQQQQPPPSASSQQQQQQQMSSRQNSLTTNSNTNSFPAKVASSVHHSLSTSNNTMTPQRKYTSNNVRPIVVQNNVSGKKNNLKDQEDPKYTDPMIGAPASFQQRLIELGALEGDTVRWERTKRLKKKKQDRDS